MPAAAGAAPSITTATRPFSTIALDDAVARATREIPIGKRGQLTGRVTADGVRLDGAVKVRDWLTGGGYLERQRTGTRWTWGAKATVTW